MSDSTEKAINLDEENNETKVDSDADDDGNVDGVEGHSGYSLQKSAMTESYSEILNSPTDLFGDDMCRLTTKTSPKRIPNRRPTSLSQSKRNFISQTNKIK